jgi:hypothetical protein
MSSIFDALPGIEVPVDEITRGLASMWEGAAAKGSPAPEADDVKATQVNFVLHFGLNSSPEDALEQFETTVKFSQRYPSRVVVLCPHLEDQDNTIEVRAKVYGECFLGKSKSDKRCVEFVMLSYSRAARPFLESQVSICFSADLPLYYWAHRFSTSGRLADYQYLLSQARRVLIDSSIAPADALTYQWPNPKSLRDLVYSRLLPVRQTVGQFLARYDFGLLVDGLKTVTVAHGESLAAEGRVMTGWLRRRLTECGTKTNQPAFATEPAPAGKLGIRFEYDSEKFFRWNGDLTTKHALFEANFGHGTTNLPASVHLLPPEVALSEAMFF